jgi:hypothetical protein
MHLAVGAFGFAKGAEGLDVCEGNATCEGTQHSMA